MLRKKLKIERAIVDHLAIDKSSATASSVTANSTTTSNFFSTNNPAEQLFWPKLFNIECALYSELLQLNYPASVRAIYNPLDYASELHCQYMQKFLDGPKDVLFVGMNPGPWGCCQTGVPFGSAHIVRDWMQLTGTVKKPAQELPTREVTGLACTRDEQSGKRFWGLLGQLCGPPESFFKHSFVYNLCPLAFFSGSGRSIKNITPAEIKGDTKQRLQEICLKHSVSTIELLQPKIIIAIGRWTEDRLKELTKQNRIDPSIVIKCLAHPSPRSLNNTNWMEKAEQWFGDNDLMRYFKSP